MNNNLVNIPELLKKNISADQYVVLMCLYNNDSKVLLKYVTSFGSFNTRLFNELKATGYINIVGEVKDEIYTFENLQLTDKFEKNILGKVEDVVSWITDWYDLWPKGITSGGYPLRSDKPACLKKMRKFIVNNEYTKEQIFQATINYIEKCKSNNYQYTRLAPYFIEKEDISLLSRECELLAEKIEPIKNTDNKTVLGADTF